MPGHYGKGAAAQKMAIKPAKKKIAKADPKALKPVHRPAKRGK